MLVVHQGGGRRRNARQALSAFAEQRVRAIRSSAPPDQVTDAERGLAVSLEICAQFLDASFADLFPAVVSPRPDRPAPSQGPASARLGAEWLARSLGPCLCLFPYQCLVGSLVIERFEAELRELAGFCLAERLIPDDQAGTVDAWLAEGTPVLATHRRIQQALEPPALGTPPPGGRVVVDGRFRVERREPGGLTLSVPGRRAYEGVRMPRAVLDHYVEGRDVCVAMIESAIGWLPLASTVPVAQGDISRLVARWSDRLSAFRPRPASTPRRGQAGARSG